MLFEKKTQQVGYGCLSHCLVNNSFHSEIPTSSQLFHHPTTSYLFSLLKQMIHQRLSTVRLISANQTMAQYLMHTNELGIMGSFFLENLSEWRVNSSSGVPYGRAVFLKVMRLAPVLCLGTNLGSQEGPALWLTNFSFYDFLFSPQCRVFPEFLGQ